MWYNYISQFDIFGEENHYEKNFCKDSCFLDILKICKRFIDVYTVGFKITDEDGMPLRNDKDVMSLMKENEGVKNIYVYLEKDETARPLNYMMPEDNSNLDSYSPVIPKVINVKISGDLKGKNKVLLEGKVIDGSEMASSAQLFLSVSDDDFENGLDAISLPKIKKRLIYTIT